MPKVSIVVPVYNHAKFLKERLDCILAQTFRDYELIILDDDSTDDSREIILDYRRNNPEIIIAFNEQNSGSPFRQWDKGIELSKGDYIWIAESDDFADSRFLEKAVHEIMKSEAIGMVFCDSLIIDEERNIEYLASTRTAAITNKEWIGFQNYSTSKKLTLFLENPIVNVSSVLLRKDTYLKIGGVERSMRYCGDWLLYAQLTTVSEIGYIPEVLNFFRLHKDSTYHEHYRTNTFLIEKFKVYLFLLKEIDCPILMSVLIFISMVKILLIRVIYILRIQSIFESPEYRISKTISFS